MRIASTLFCTLAFSIGAYADTIQNRSFEFTDFFVGNGCGNIAACIFNAPAFAASFPPWVLTGDTGVALVGSGVNSPAPLPDGDQYAFISNVGAVAQTPLRPRQEGVNVDV